MIGRSLRLRPFNPYFTQEVMLLFYLILKVVYKKLWTIVWEFRWANSQR